jgi:hypothetical protein
MNVFPRYIDTETGYVEEHFVTFIIQERTSVTLTGTILGGLRSLGLSIKDCHGQGYDSRGNMHGNNSGVKMKLLAISPAAFFTVCGCQNCSLLLGKATG